MLLEMESLAGMYSSALSCESMHEYGPRNPELHGEKSSPQKTEQGWMLLSPCLQTRHHVPVDACRTCVASHLAMAHPV